ncbi:MAG TPA: DNA-3-methyladenine glycosylase I [Dehalococcoidia bacterium]|nr:DNA-3-methyladenine glycosylase I [Dehalococcoidia bacterium]
MTQEYGPPPQIVPTSLRDYLDAMSKPVFQSGMSWKVVNSKWGTTREAFSDFDPDTVAAFGESDIDRLAEDTRVIRNRRKLQAVANNAARMVELEAEHGSFGDYLRSHQSFDATAPTYASSSASWARPAATSSSTSSASPCPRTMSGKRRARSSGDVGSRIRRAALPSGGTHPPTR